MNNFQVKINRLSKRLTKELIEFEGSDYTETVNVVLSTKKDVIFKSFYIKNTILFDEIEDQMNVVGINTDSYKKTTTYRKSLSERWLEVN